MAFRSSVSLIGDWTDAAKQGTSLSEWTTDGCHPNVAGHRQMAETMLRKILGRLGSRNGSKQ